MKHTLNLRWTLVGLLMAATLVRAEVKPLQPSHLEGHGLPAGPAVDVLPGGAVIHVQVNGLMPVIEGLEGVLKAGVPVKLLPPDAQGLLQMPHPLLMVAGMKLTGAPLDQATIAERFGLAVQRAVTVSLYPGDPRRMFMVTIPLAQSGPMAELLTGLLQPREVESVDLGPGRATRVVPGQGAIRELYLACSSDRLYVTGDRALALALHALPPAERLGRDDFIKRALSDPKPPDVAVVCDPRMVKPLVVQLQQLQPLGMVLLHQKRLSVLASLPAVQRQQLEQQFRAQFGVENLDQMADYVEAIVKVTSQQILDYVTNRTLSVEGLCLTATLDPQFPELSLQVFSRDCQPDSSTGSIPLAEVKKALERVGSDCPSIVVSGRRPTPETNAGLKKWTSAVREELAARELRSTWFDRLADLLAQSQAVTPMEARAPWTLTVQAPIDPQPDLAEARSVLAYLQTLNLPVNRAVTMQPGLDTSFLEQCLRDETEVLNRNRTAEVEFNRQTTGQEPWFDHVNRLRAPRPDAPVRRFVMESAWLTHGGWFGYDRHELINRRWFFARTLDDYLIYHRGGQGPEWLRDLPSKPAEAITPAVARLLDRLPPDVNYFEIHRTLQQLPPLVAWLGTIEDRIHADLGAYLDKARETAASAGSIEEANARLARLPMPDCLYSLNRRPDSGELYATLPGNLMFPRPKVVPLVREVLAEYAESSREVGGCLVYTRVTPGVWKVGLLQSTEALTRLISSAGNAVAERFLSSPEGQERLRTSFWTGQDARPETFAQIVVANPRWNFIPRLQPKAEARPKKLPPRDPAASDRQIDLGPFFNGSIEDGWQAGGVANNTLANLPRGIHEFGGIEFEVRGVVQLNGQGAADQLTVSFPKSIEGIPIRRHGAKVHFLHACGWAAEQDAVIGHFVLHYANGERRERPIVYGQDVCDWWAVPLPQSESHVVWRGQNDANPSGPPKSVYLTTWDNPLPDVEITHLDYTSTMSQAAPFLLAVTIED